MNVDWGMDISGAIEHARVHDQLLPWVVDVENTIEAGVADVLREKGHNVSGASGDGRDLICETTYLTTLLLVVSDILLSYAAVQGVMRTQDGHLTGKPWSLPVCDTPNLPVCPTAASDSRKYGIAAGY